MLGVTATVFRGPDVDANVMLALKCPTSKTARRRNPLSIRCLEVPVFFQETGD